VSFVIFIASLNQDFMLFQSEVAIFQKLFHQYGASWTFSSTVWIHYFIMSSSSIRKNLELLL